MSPTPRPDPAGADPEAPVVLRPGGARLLAAGWWAVAALLVGDLLWRGSDGSALLGVPLVLLSCAVVHALFWYPAVVVDGDGVELVNVLRTVRVPWAAVSEVDTRWALTVAADGRRWTSWAAPASGRRVRPVSRRDTPWAPPGSDAIAGSRAPGSSAGEVAVLVENRWQRWRDHRRGGDGGAQPGPHATPRVRWNPPVLLSLAVAVTLAAAAVLAVATR